MQQKFLNHINKKFPFLKDKKLLIAISGGLDSVVLTQLLTTGNFNIALAHCNFNLRGQESDLDEEFVKKLGNKISCEVFTTQFNTEVFAKKNKQSTQITARNLRYNWFKELLQKHQFDYVLTAHHADDNLETFLINLTRGTGLEGLTGIPEINGTIVRPLLPFSRLKIIKFAKENKIDWREDKSNLSTKYTRNKIRHKVIPVLKEINPSLLETFANTTEHLQESLQIINDKIENISNNVLEISESFKDGLFKIDIKKINQQSNPKAYLYQLLKAYHFTEWNDVYNLRSALSGKQVFSKSHVLLKDRNYLILSKKNENSSFKDTFIQEHQQEIKDPIALMFESVNSISTKNKQIIYIDKEKISYPLKLRKWQNGDVFYPLGMNGKRKKVSKYFKDEKLSLLQKQNTWFLCNNDDAIIWIIGFRQDHRFTSSKSTKNKLRIEFVNSSVKE